MFFLRTSRDWAGQERRGHGEMHAHEDGVRPSGRRKKSREKKKTFSFFSHFLSNLPHLLKGIFHPPTLFSRFTSFSSFKKQQEKVVWFFSLGEVRTGVLYRHFYIICAITFFPLLLFFFFFVLTLLSCFYWCHYFLSLLLLYR